MMKVPFAHLKVPFVELIISFNMFKVTLILFKDVFVNREEDERKEEFGDEKIQHNHPTFLFLSTLYCHYVHLIIAAAAHFTNIQTQ